MLYAVVSGMLQIYVQILLPTQAGEIEAFKTGEIEAFKTEYESLDPSIDPPHPLIHLL
jgi:hypothetical protein